MKNLRQKLAKLGLAAGILAISMPAMAVVTIDVTPGGGDPAGAIFSDCEGAGVNCTNDGSVLSCPDLRSAVDCANQNTAAGDPFSVINVPAETITLTEVLNVIAANLDINGAGRDATVIDGDDNQIMNVDLNGLSPMVSHLTVRDLTLTNGEGLAVGGGAIFNNGKNLDIFNVRFFLNSSIAGFGGALNMDNMGGMNSPRLRIRDSIFEENSAVQGGALYMNLSNAGGAGGAAAVDGIQRTSFFNNSAITFMGISGLGGAIYVEDGSIELRNVTVAQNSWNEVLPDNGGIFLQDIDDDHLFQNVAVTDPIFVGAAASLELRNAITTQCLGAGTITEPAVGGGNLTVLGSNCIDEGLAGNFTSPDVPGLGLGAFSAPLGYYPLVAGSLAIDNANPGFPIGADQINGDTDVRPMDGDGDGDADEDIGPIEFEFMGEVDVCGNGLCEAGEDATSCPADCGTGVCGNLVCDLEAGENPTTCPADCEADVCGNGVCEEGEIYGPADYCVPDCGPNPQILDDVSVSGAGCSLNQTAQGNLSQTALTFLLGLSVLAAFRFKNKYNA